MTSPAYISACCQGNSSVLVNIDSLLDQPLVRIKTVSCVSLVFACFSCAGLALLCPWTGQQGSGVQSQLFQTDRAGRVVRWLVLAGVLANIGIIIRSGLWIQGRFPLPKDTHYGDFNHVFCIVISVWVQYFFLCEIFWHFVYGLETFMVSNGGSSSRFTRHILGWLMPALLCSIGAWLAYEPVFRRCAMKTKNTVNIGMMYALFLAPILVVLLLLILLFYKAHNRVKRTLIQHFGRFAAAERQIMDAIAVKFIIFTLGFSICWIPNLLNAAFMNVTVDRTEEVPFFLLVIQSVLNPNQVLITTLVLYGWPSSMTCCFKKPSRHGYQPVPGANINDLDTSARSERDSDPMLSFSGRSRR